MTRKQRAWIIAAGGGVLVLGVAATVIASALSRSFEPFVREQATEYLGKRFDSEVELATLRVHLPKTSPVRLLISRGRGVIARVEGGGLVLRHKRRRDIPPLFAMKKFAFEVDLGSLFDSQKIVNQVHLDGVDIYVPPAGERPALPATIPPENGGDKRSPASTPSVLIRTVLIDSAGLTILPKDRKKVPLHFDIHHLRLDSAGAGVPMKYDATLVNARPPGNVHSTGVFGPWSAEDPGKTPLRGEYAFHEANLGVFPGIAGVLNSTGSFSGALSSIDVKGRAVVPDFRLKRVGNPVALSTLFQVLVDGTNGNTVLKPVVATLGGTTFTTSGGVIKHEGDTHRTLTFDVSMPNGNVRDLLRLAAKGPPFMEGRIFLKSKIHIPPLSGKVREKLVLDGRFEIVDGKFLRSKVQDQIDQLSRRGQGEPTSEEIDEVVSYMAGDFRLENETMTFRSVSFGVPGAHVALAGTYDLEGDKLDMRGSLRLQAKVSQTMTGWKRWALKPVDPFFSKRGAGTFLRIRVEGTSRQPKFGLDHGP